MSGGTPPRHGTQCFSAKLIVHLPDDPNPPAPRRESARSPNAPGTIDPGYRGEVRVILLNLGREPYTVRAGDRIAQMIVARYEAVEWEEGDLADSRRGTGGFGSSGR